MPIEVLSEGECLALLRTHEIGRLAVVGHFPEVFPVNYAMVGDRVLLRTDRGTKSKHARFERVCFEVDDLDRTARTGWSVVLKGVLHELDDADEAAEELRAVAAGIRPWAATTTPRVLVVTTVSLTGRRIVARDAGEGA